MATMASRFYGFDRLNGIKSTLQNLTDTSLRFYDMDDFQRRLKVEPIYLIIERLRESVLVEIVRFLLQSKPLN